VLEQLDLLGEILPEMRREFEARRPATVPSDPPSHAQRTALRAAAADGVRNDRVAV
jgi:hypothetical protein